MNRGAFPVLMTVECFARKDPNMTSPEAGDSKINHFVMWVKLVPSLME